MRRIAGVEETILRDLEVSRRQLGEGQLFGGLTPGCVLVRCQIDAPVAPGEDEARRFDSGSAHIISVMAKWHESTVVAGPLPGQSERTESRLLRRALTKS